MPAAIARRDQIRKSREEIRDGMIAATRELLRTRSFSELTVDDVMRPTGQGRTVFYRHFDDLGDLLARAAGEAIERLYDAQSELAQPRAADPADAVRQALAQAVAVFREHGPLLRALVEASAADGRLAAAVETLRRRFDDLTAQALRDMAAPADPNLSDVAEIARALTLMNEGYLLDAFGREPRMSADAAVATLGDVWAAVVDRSVAD
jgi:AcrR family transcriptional regulator